MCMIHIDKALNPLGLAAAEAAQGTVQELKHGANKSGTRTLRKKSNHLNHR